MVLYQLFLFVMILSLGRAFTRSSCPQCWRYPFVGTSKKHMQRQVRMQGTTQAGEGDSSMDFKSAYKWALDRMQDEHVDEADLAARYLLSDAAQIGTRFSDFKRAEAENTYLSTAQYNMLQSHVRKRVANMPVQYILGNWDFYGMTLDCEEPVLIPRPETEELVERILDSQVIPSTGKILDIGAGTGAVGLAILSKIPKATCVALDINEVAVSLAQRNARKVLGQADADVRYRCELFDFVDWAAAAAGGGSGGGVDVIVSNPPYIPSAEMNDLKAEVRDYEDHRALHGGDDGMDLIRRIIKMGPSLLSADGPAELWMEVARRHPDAIRRHVEEYNAALDARNDTRRRFVFVEGMRDLSGNPRFVRLRVQKK